MAAKSNTAALRPAIGSPAPIAWSIQPLDALPSHELLFSRIGLAAPRTDSDEAVEISRTAATAILLNGQPSLLESAVTSTIERDAEALPFVRPVVASPALIDIPLADSSGEVRGGSVTAAALADGAGAGDDISDRNSGNNGVIAEGGDDGDSKPVLAAPIGNPSPVERPLQPLGGSGSLSVTFAAGILTVTGTTDGDTLVIGRTVGGLILLNGIAPFESSVPSTIAGGMPSTIAKASGTPSVVQPTVGNTTLIRVIGGEGNDTISLDQSNGPLPPAQLTGGAGDDILTGGSGSDILTGGADNDTLTGAAGGDQLFGDAGDDRMIWNPGDGSDLFEGGDDADTAEVNGGGGDEVFTLAVNGARVAFARVDPAPFALDIGTTERIVVNMNGGDDDFSASGNLAALIAVTVDGGAGNDTILGSNGGDELHGGDDNDFIDGQQGGDTAFLGAGDDVFQWDPGDGSDVVEGGSGTDTLLFNASAASEILVAAASGARLLFTRNVGNILMDLDDVETLTINALGGADSVTINDMTGTDVTQVDVDLTGTVGGVTGDGMADTVTINGRAGNDVIDILGASTSYLVTGLAAQLNVANAEGANDMLVVNAGGGDDTITATTLPAGVTRVTIDGGAGDDTIHGSQGADILFGGDNDDFVFGDNGNDVAFLGAGNDVFQWEPGDGNDTVEGQDGTDALIFVGSNAAEDINLVANGGRALFTRNVANVVMDLDDVEQIDYRALGGADNIVVADLTGTDVTSVSIDLTGPMGGGDAAVDSVTVGASQTDDVFGIASNASGLTIFGLQAAVSILGVEAANDRVTLNGFGGEDVINATSLAAGVVSLTINGGLGDDVILGSAGGDLINGGDGNDTALMGDGDDTFTWNPGDDNDTIEGQDGLDTLLFNGANVAETINITANGGRVLFTRNIANVVMDMNDVEEIRYNALGGADVITINDLSGTDVTAITIDLGSDGADDIVVINATNADDVILVTGANGSLTVLGLDTVINILNYEATDKLIINSLGGNDVIEASGLDVGIIFQADGGDNDDVIVGGNGDDILLGGLGDDVLIGGPGLDALDGGAGSNVLIP